MCTSICMRNDWRKRRSQGFNCWPSINCGESFPPACWKSTKLSVSSKGLVLSCSPLSLRVLQVRHIHITSQDPELLSITWAMFAVCSPLSHLRVYFSRSFWVGYNVALCSSYFCWHDKIPSCVAKSSPPRRHSWPLPTFSVDFWTRKPFAFTICLFGTGLTLAENFGIVSLPRRWRVLGTARLL